jgi:ketosteroid isomerase-like protein
VIEVWLGQFHEAWKTHDIDAAMNLFTDDVEYWETPHKLLEDKTKVREEWQAILKQEDIAIKWSVFNSSVDNRHSVVWSLQYLQAGVIKHSSGVYLIELNESGLCNYFYYTGQSE